MKNEILLCVCVCLVSKKSSAYRFHASFVTDWMRNFFSLFDFAPLCARSEWFASHSLTLNSETHQKHTSNCEKESKTKGEMSVEIFYGFTYNYIYIQSPTHIRILATMSFCVVCGEFYSSLWGFRWPNKMKSFPGLYLGFVLFFYVENA